MAKARTAVSVTFDLVGSGTDTCPDEITIFYLAEDAAAAAGYTKKNRFGKTLSAGEQSTLQGFINSVVLPAVNTDAGIT